MLRALPVLAATLCLAFGSRATGGESKSPVAVRPRETWSGVFGGRPARFHFDVEARQAFRGRAGWSCRASGRTLARGEVAVAAEPGKPAGLEVRLDVPPVKPGVVMPAVLTVEIFGPGGGPAVGSFQKPLWVFPEDPLPDRSRWLARLKLHLFDPQGRTHQCLKRLGVPLLETRNVDAIPAMRQGVLLVGEGTSLVRYRGLASAMTKAAAGGVPVLCLAPSEGTMVLPGTRRADLPSPQRLVLRHADVIGELDKRLDALGWPPDGRIAACTLQVAAERNRVTAEVVRSGEGWPWLEADFPGSGGRLVVCGFGLVEKWDDGPTPRFLFARLLEYVCAEPQSSKDKKDKGETR